MRKSYVTPEMKVEEFTPNEYCSTCGESGTTYKFVCNAAKNWGFDFGGSVYQETNGREGLQTNSDKYLGEYQQCSATHIAEHTDDFLEGYFAPNGFIDTGVRKVVIWRGAYDDNIHCTTTLDKEDWETAKS